MAALLILAGQTFGQNLYVIAARGNVKSKKTGKNLRSGDIIPTDDILTFRDQTDLLSLMTEEGARFVVAYPLKRFKKKKAEYPLDLVRTQGAPATYPADPSFFSNAEAKAFFSTRPFVFLGPETRFRMNKKVFPMSRALFFYMNYDFKEDNIDKKIDYRGDTVILAKRALFKIDGKEVDGKYAENFQFYYYNQPKNQHTFLGKMQPYFPVDERLKEETDVLVNRLTLRQATPETIVKELAGFMQQHYGNVWGSDLTQWVKEQYPALAGAADAAYAVAQTEADAAAKVAAAEALAAEKANKNKNKRK